MKLSQTVAGFVLFRSTDLAQNTLTGYRHIFAKLQTHLADPDIATITATDIVQYLDYLATTPQPMGGVARRPPRPLSRKSRLNVHAALSSLFTWAVSEGYAPENIMRHVPRPRPEQRAILPFTREDILALLDAADKITYTRQEKLVHAARQTAIRDRAIIALLLDTGMRASELCHATVGDLDLKNNRLRVMGKGSKERVLMIDTRTAKAVWRYLTEYRAGAPDSAPLFTNHGTDDEPLTRRNLITLLHRIGSAAGVRGCHPHKFRHTFAINFLKNGGNLYALQATLGHTTLDMCKRYLAISQADTEEAHKLASPVANWKLRP